MDTLLKADIFFFVTTIAVVLFTAFAAVAVIYLIKILRDVRAVASMARKEAERITDDIAAVRERVKTEGAKGLGVLMALARLFTRKGPAPPSQGFGGRGKGGSASRRKRSV